MNTDVAYEPVYSELVPGVEIWNLFNIQAQDSAFTGESNDKQTNVILSDGHTRLSFVVSPVAGINSATIQTLHAKLNSLASRDMEQLYDKVGYEKMILISWLYGACNKMLENEKQMEVLEAGVLVAIMEQEIPVLENLILHHRFAI
jgi:hypothetical protein